MHKVFNIMSPLARTALDLRPEFSRVDATRSYPPSRVILLSCSAGAAAQALTSALDQNGYQVIATHTEDEALDALETAAVELILVYLQAADPTRLDFVKLQRMSHPADPLLPVLVLADVMTAAVEQACADARVDLRVTGPIEPNHLLDYISDLCASRPRD